MIYRCLLCGAELPAETIIAHVKAHDNFWIPSMTIPSTLEDFKARYTPLGLDVIEEVK